MDIRQVAVIGAGLMGSGIAQSIAQAGIRVSLYDISPTVLDRAIQTVEKSLTRFVKAGKLSIEEVTEILGRIQVKTELAEACNEVQLVIEAIPENLELKRQLFSQLDQYTDEECILATNTSELSVTAIASATNRPSRVVGMHWFNPAPVMKLIELVRAVDTSDKALKTVEELLSFKTPKAL